MTEILNQCNLQLVECSSPYTTILNRNLLVDGMNIIYLSGSCIVLQTIFNRRKQFIQRINPGKVLAMCSYDVPEGILVLMIQTSNKSIIEFYSNGDQTKKYEFITNIQVIDIQHVSEDIILLIGLKSNYYGLWLIINTEQISYCSIDAFKPIKIKKCSHHLYIICQQALLQCQINGHSITYKIKFFETYLKDYTQINENQSIILHNATLSYKNDFHLNENPNFIIHFNKHILITYSNILMLTHFIVQKDRLQFVNNYIYKQNFNANIINVSLAEDQLILALAVLIIDKDGNKIENFLFNLDVIFEQQKFVNAFVRVDELGTQCSSISSLNNCLLNDIYHLAGSQIINYNYISHICKKNKYNIHEVAKKLLVHPLGYQFVCIFDTFIKFYHRTEIQLIQIWKQALVCLDGTFSSTGLLALCCHEEYHHQIILYNVNTFKKTNKIININLKNALSSIQWINNSTQLVLYCSQQMSIYDINASQKVAQLQHHKVEGKLNCLKYDPKYETVIALSQTCLFHYHRLGQNQNTFRYQKKVQIPFKVTHLLICHALQTLFMCCSSGQVIWTPYPLKLQHNNINLPLNSLQLSFSPIKQIVLTNNLNFMLLILEDNLVSICKITQFKNSFSNLYDIGNLNLLQTSSKTFIQNHQNKLKQLLQKRKTIFNELEQFKNEWQNKKQNQRQNLKKQYKIKQLNTINQTLQQINQVENKKQKIIEQISFISKQIQQYKKNKQQQFKQQIKIKYAQTDLLKNSYNVLKIKLEEQFNQIQQNCILSKQEISKQINIKFTKFVQNYELMKNNLIFYSERIIFQQKQGQSIQDQLSANQKHNLLQQQTELYDKMSEIKLSLNELRKKMEKIRTNQDDLQMKKKILINEQKQCLEQVQLLKEIKVDLDYKLVLFQKVTHHRQTEISQSLCKNSVFAKYQKIHEDMVKSYHEEIDFLKDRKIEISQHTIEIQQELSTISEQNQKYKKQIEENTTHLQDVQQLNLHKTYQWRYMNSVLDQIIYQIEMINNQQNENTKIKKFEFIYKNFYINKNLQNLIKCNTKCSKDSGKEEQLKKKTINQKQQIKEETYNSLKIQQNLQNHLQYLNQNMKKIKNYNKFVNQQIDSNYSKISKQNYNLISECNIKKQQTNKKKRILHQLINSYKQKKFQLSEILKKEQNLDKKDHINNNDDKKLKYHKSLPYVNYEIQKQNQCARVSNLIHQPFIQSDFPKKTKTIYQIKKMLNIEKIPSELSSNFKRLLTAKVRQVSNFDNMYDHSHNDNDGLIHPLKNIRKLRTAEQNRLPKRPSSIFLRKQARQKVNSKPTTCASISKVKN